MTSNLGLYVHWPWCVRKCPYCDFNSHAVTGKLPEQDYVNALLADLRHAYRAVNGREVTSVFVGGGTPSLISAEGFAALMSGVRSIVNLSASAEITMEANPGTVEAERFRAYAQAGVNRISIGIQSFSDAKLKALGRIHSRDEALAAIEAAKAVVDEVNLDVMFALPGQSMRELDEDLTLALKAETSHLSFYELTIEEGTAFYKRVPDQLPDVDLAADMADHVHQTLVNAGFEHYEISAYARPGHQCRHNSTYWTFGDYLGVGAGAHGKLTVDGQIVRTVRSANPRVYLHNVELGVFEAERRVVEKEDLPFEFMLNALRLRNGVLRDEWERHTGLGIDVIDPVLTQLQKEGLLEKSEKRIVPTELGRRFLSDLQERFLTVSVP